MLRVSILSACLLCVACVAPQQSSASHDLAQFADASTAHYLIAETEIALLIDDPAAKAAIDRHLPGLTESDQVGLIGGLTLVDLQQFLPALVTDEKLASIQADFDRI